MLRSPRRSGTTVGRGIKDLLTAWEFSQLSAVEVAVMLKQRITRLTDEQGRRLETLTLCLGGNLEELRMTRIRFTTTRPSRTARR